MNTEAQAAAQPDRSRLWASAWRWLFGLGVLGLMAWAAREIDWPEVGKALRQLPARTLMAAAAFAAFSHLLYACYDLLGRAWVGHRLRWPRVMETGFVCYAFNMNLGSLVGGVALRFRLYHRLGLHTEQIGKLFGFSLVTNWMGYAVLAGGVCLFHGLRLPADWPVHDGALPWLGAALWLVVGGYLALCVFAGQRRFSLRGTAFKLPSWRLALLQVGVSGLNWLSIACVIWLLLPQGLAYPQVLAALLAAVVAGVVTHIPAGIGVLEGVFMALLTPVCAAACPSSAVLAALLAYRALYYLLPLCAAATVYFFLESRA